MIQLNFLAEWGSIVPWLLQDQVEQDLIISRALVEIYQVPLLKNKLAFRGGTALHKNHLSKAYRY
jgi:predicted nucleotidyltransferase component of viral defense system